MSRAVYVYRLVVTLPEQPPTEEQIKEATRYSATGYYPMEGRPFRWPRRRVYLSGDAAQRRARLLRALGAEVKVEWARVDEWRPWGDP